MAMDQRVLPLPVIEIEYCRQCRWLARAAWTAQELLTTFEDEIGGVTLVPGTGGIFDVRVNGETVFSRKAAGRHADVAEIKQLVRDRVAPERSLGHSDKVRADGVRADEASTDKAGPGKQGTREPEIG